VSSPSGVWGTAGSGAEPRPQSHFAVSYARNHKTRQLRWQRFFYRAKLRIAWYCQGKLSVRLHVCMSVTLRYCDHIGWNSAEIILLSADHKMTDLLQRKGTSQLKF